MAIYKQQQRKHIILLTYIIDLNRADSIVREGLGKRPNLVKKNNKIMIRVVKIITAILWFAMWLAFLCITIAAFCRMLNIWFVEVPATDRMISGLFFFCTSICLGYLSGFFKELIHFWDW